MFSENRPDHQGRHKPGLQRWLELLGIDVAYHRAQGDFVYTRDAAGSEIEVLDLVGGYGTLLLGHAHPALLTHARGLLSDGFLNHAQGSNSPTAARLADELSRRARGDYVAVFANSGTEAVEAAMKHAMLQTGSRTFLALEGGFHGKTLGAVQLTANRTYREPFAVEGIDVVRVRPNDISHLESSVAHAERIAGFLFEPVQGEGGVRPLTSEFLSRAVELASGKNFPLIADECQTGLGRTGEFLACHARGIQPDYVILSKALGGGLAKISALLIDRRQYIADFDLLHSSTFAGDEFSLALAMKTLELLDEATIDGCRRQGAKLKSRLCDVQQRHPTIIADVRGEGLMLGVEFQRQSDSKCFTQRYLAEREFLGPIIASYLLNAHRIRIAPTLSDPLTLRIQPSAFVADAVLERIIAALDDVCDRLARYDIAGLTRFMSTSPMSDAALPTVLTTKSPIIYLKPARDESRSVSKSERRAAWLFHLVDGADLPHLDPELSGLTSAARERLLETFAPLAEPIALPSTAIRSRTGTIVRLQPIVLPVTSSWMKRSLHEKQHPARGLVQRGVDVAAALGCEVVSLGQFTSIVTRGGRTLTATNIAITTGNSFTTALVMQAIRQSMSERDVLPATLTLAILGATGNIGRLCAEMLGHEFGSVILVGSWSASSCSQLREIAGGIPDAIPSHSLADVGQADVVLCATNSVHPLLGPEHFAPGAIVCDVSIPSIIKPETAKHRPDLTLIDGAVVRLPGDEDLQIPGLPLARGLTYGCMAEGLLLALEGIRDTSFTGTLCRENIPLIAQWGTRHGFELADVEDVDHVSCVSTSVIS
ncbi:MAG: aminotransferase class III-fold pyridoxal phosphate-dependent enzyme [Planctomycetaceae bacterium]